MRMLYVTVFHVKDGEPCSRSMYYQTPNQGDDLQGELLTCFRNLGIEEVQTYTLQEVCKAPFISYALGLLD